MTLRRLAARCAFYALLAAIVLYTIFPFYWGLVSSLETGTALFDANLLPSAPNAENYVAEFAEQPFGRNIVNSVAVAGGVVGLSLALGVGAAYALGRAPFRGQSILLFVVLGASMFPQVAVLGGMFEMVTALGLYNRLGSLVVSYLVFTLPFTVWVLATFMRELPRELEEASMIDGASPLTTLLRVLVPVLAPALAATGLLAMIAAWNEFLFALTFILTEERRTVPVAIALISGASQHELPWGRVMAASIIVTVPLVVLVLIFQRHIVAGLTRGALKQ